MKRKFKNDDGNDGDIDDIDDDCQREGKEKNTTHHTRPNEEVPPVSTTEDSSPRSRITSPSMPMNFNSIDNNNNNNSKNNNNNTASSIRAASRKTRVYIFHEFVKKLYPNIPSGSVILDIAGGKGDLSWLLKNIDDWNSIVIDPRKTITSDHILRSIQYLKDHPQEAKQRSMIGLPTYQPLAKLLPQLEGKTTFHSPKHLRIFVNNEFVQAIQSYQQNSNEIEWNKYWNKAILHAKKGDDETQVPSSTSTSTTFNKDDESVMMISVQESNEILQLLLSTKLILGFHPDQATDPAMDLAIHLQIPYCIVPCCVFPRENLHRILPSDGQPVKQYGQLIQYLQSKYDSEIDTLPFHFTETAKNIVLYSKSQVKNKPE